MSGHKTNKHTLLILLMILSEVLLAIFVGSWLISQYREEKDLLRDELVVMYADSREEVMDTLLINRIIIPSMAGDYPAGKSSEYNDSISYGVDDTVQMSVFIGRNADTLNTGRAMYSVSVMDSSIILPGDKNASGEFQSGLNELLIRSTKLFMFQTSDSLSEGSTLKVVLRDLIDTALFKQKFSGKIENAGFGVTVGWDEHQSDTAEKHNSNYLLIYEDHADNLPLAVISHYRIYLLKKISPQISFATILLVLTSLAFFLANKSLQKQVMLNRLRNDFVSNLTHELKTPVATVKVALEALRRYNSENDTKRTTEYLEMSALEMERLDGLIAKVLNHTMLEDNTAWMNIETFDAFDLINKIVQRLQPRLEVPDAKIKVESTGEITMQADRLLCEGMIINLIDNSLKYCDRKPEITIRIGRAGNHVVIEVADNGPGIPPEYLNRIFDKFFRIPAGDTHNIKGHGLGLSFVDLVMRSHGGKVKVQNLKPRGTLFSLTFPG